MCWHDPTHAQQGNYTLYALTSLQEDRDKQCLYCMLLQIKTLHLKGICAKSYHYLYSLSKHSHADTCLIPC